MRGWVDCRCSEDSSSGTGHTVTHGTGTRLSTSLHLVTTLATSNMDSDKNGAPGSGGTVTKPDQEHPTFHYFKLRKNVNIYFVSPLQVNWAIVVVYCASWHLCVFCLSPIAVVSLKYCLNFYLSKDHLIFLTYFLFASPLQKAFYFFSCLDSNSFKLVEEVFNLETHYQL